MSLDAELAAALRRDYREADLTPQDRAMLDFTAKLTKEAYKTTPDDLDNLPPSASTTGRSCKSR